MQILSQSLACNQKNLFAYKLKRLQNQYQSRVVYQYFI